MIARAFRQHFPIAVLAALPLVGLAAGPAYAPMVFGLGVLVFVWDAASTRRLPRTDPSLIVVAVLFAGLCWLSAVWSIVPERTVRGSLQVTAVFLAALIFLSQKPLSDASIAVLMRIMAVAFLVGGIVIAVDTAAGFPIQRVLSSEMADVSPKYNRGAIYAVLIAWPVAGHLWRSRAIASLCALVLGLGMIVAFDVALTTKVAMAVGMATLGASLLAPRFVPAVPASGAVLLVASLPVLLRAISERRAVLSPFLKNSGQHRLELWNYMTARVFERPVTGWGFSSASSVPIRPEELSTYSWVSPKGIYPHDQWLQLWTETGALGAAVGIGFLVLVWRGLRELPAAMRPFATAGFAAAMTVSLLDFDVATDSWWAALAACAFLFRSAAKANANSEQGPAPASPPR